MTGWCRRLLANDACHISGEGRVIILVIGYARGKTPRSSTGGVLEDEFRAEIRGYYLYPQMAVDSQLNGRG
jgi:hypothetical protein